MISADAAGQVTGLRSCPGRRVERLNRGRVSPNVQRVRNIGAPLTRIKQAMPGL